MVSHHSEEPLWSLLSGCRHRNKMNRWNAPQNAHHFSKLRLPSSGHVLQGCGELLCSDRHQPETCNSCRHWIKDEDGMKKTFETCERTKKGSIQIIHFHCALILASEDLPKSKVEKKALIDLTADWPFLASSKKLGQEHSDHPFFEQLKGRKHKATVLSSDLSSTGWPLVFSTEHCPLCPCVHVPICLCRSHWSRVEKQKANAQKIGQVQDDTKIMKESGLLRE